MLKFALRVLLNGFLLAFVLPAMFTSVTFHGAFWPQAVVAGFLLAFVVYIVELLFLVTGFVTFGFAWLFRWLFWFLVPALQLLALASWFPEYMSIGSFWAAVGGGFVFLLVNAITGTTTTGANKQ